MNVVFRCDASIQIGTGHVMRCLTLADELARQGAKCYFICREHKGNLIDFITQKGYETYTLEAISLGRSKKNKAESTLFHSEWLGATQETDAKQTLDIVSSIQPEWLVIDHYALDSYWQGKLRPHCDNILVIDDLADRKHDCDILLDQTFGRNRLDYQNLVPNHCEILCGTTYALLRPEFSEWRQYSLTRRKDNKLQHILINLGGVDKDNITSNILESLKHTLLPQSCKITVVMGPTSPWIDTVKNKAKQLPWSIEVKTGVSNMAELMANSDLAIGAAGSTIWERFCLGLPTILLVIAQNQESNLNKVKPYHIDFFRKDDFNFKEVLVETIQQLNSYPILLKNNTKIITSLVDGQGTKRISQVLLKEELL